MSVPKKTNRRDGILSPEELQKAIEEYKASRAAAAAQDGNPESAPAADPAPAAEENPVTDGDEGTVAPASEDTIEGQVAAIKEANSDCGPDMQKLLDIIDSLLAERAFKAADGEGCASEPAAQQDSEDDPIPTASEPTVNADSADAIDAIVRSRIHVGMMGRSLNLDGLENMNLMDAKKAVIKAVRPTMNLDGRSAVYINAAYDMACSEIKNQSVKDTNYQKRQMFNSSTRVDSASGAGNGESAAERRQAMIDRTNKKKEDK